MIMAKYIIGVIIIAGLYVILYDSGLLHESPSVVEIKDPPPIPSPITYAPGKVDTKGVFPLAVDIHDPQPAGVDLGGVTRYAIVSGRLKSASFRVLASVEGGPINWRWDDVYFKIGNGREEHGGHFTWGGDYDLSPAVFFPNLGRADVEWYDFVPLLNSGRKLRFDLFISSARSDRVIHEAVLIYECDGLCDISLVE